MKKSIITVLACCLMISAIFATSYAKEPVHVKFMHWWSYVDDNVVKAFEKENPGIKVDMEYVAIDQYPNKVKMLSVSNELPDVFALQDVTFAEFAKQHKLMDLTPVLTTPAYDKNAPWGKTIQPALEENVTQTLAAETQKENKQYGVPFGAITVAMVYNKNIFAKVGIKAPKTWGEFLGNCEKLKAAGYIPLSFTGKVWGDWWLRIAIDQTMRDVKPEDFYSRKVKFTDPRFVEALASVQNMWNKGYFDPGGFTNGIEETQALFVQGKLAQFYVVPENFVTYLINNSPKDVKLDAFPLPPMKGGSYRSLGGAPNIVVIHAATKQKAVAIKFAKYLVSQKIFRLLAPQNVVPSIAGYKPPVNNPIMKAYADASAGGFIVAQTPENQDSKLREKLYRDIYAKLLLNNMNPKEAAQELQTWFEENSLQK